MKRRHQLAKPASPVLLALLVVLSACTTIGHEKVEGWPSLRVYEHHVPHKVMRDRCVKYAAFGSTPIACAEFNLTRGRCDIFYSADFPPSKATIEHERLHCQGYDHVGETNMRDLLRRYRGGK